MIKCFFLEGAIEEKLKLLKNEHFDLILMISVLEHISNPSEILRIIYDKLSIGGILIINVPTWSGKWMIEFLAFKLRTNKTAYNSANDHRTYFDKRDLWPLLVKAGFKPSEMKQKYYCFNWVLLSKSKK